MLILIDAMLFSHVGILVLFTNVNKESSVVQYGIVVIDAMLFTENAEKYLFRLL